MCSTNFWFWPARAPFNMAAWFGAWDDLVFCAEFAAEDHVGGLLRDHVRRGIGVG